MVCPLGQSCHPGSVGWSSTTRRRLGCHRAPWPAINPLHQKRPYNRKLPVLRRVSPTIVSRSPEKFARSLWKIFQLHSQPHQPAMDPKLSPAPRALGRRLYQVSKWRSTLPACRIRESFVRPPMATFLWLRPKPATSGFFAESPAGASLSKCPYSPVDWRSPSVSIFIPQVLIRSGYMWQIRTQLYASLTRTAIWRRGVQRNILQTYPTAKATRPGTSSSLPMLMILTLLLQKRIGPISSSSIPMVLRCEFTHTAFAMP